MTAKEEDLVRWLYVCAGASTRRLATEFGVSTAEIERIVSSGLGNVLRPESERQRQPGERVIDVGAPVRQEEPEKDYELIRRVASAALSD